jgi:hypothetical protein
MPMFRRNVLLLSSEEFLRTQNWRQHVVRYVMEENMDRNVLLLFVAVM